MEKPYDIKDLIGKLKGHGLDIAEDGAKIVIEELINWIDESATISASPYDDIIKLVLPQIKAKALELADKIDGQAG